MRVRTPVVVVCPFFYTTDPRRAEITRRLFRSLRGVTLLGIGSEGAVSRDLFCESHPADRYFEYVQDFDLSAMKNRAGGCEGLRRKYDFAVQAAKRYRPGHVFVVGSDDFMLDSHLQASVDYFRPSTADLVIATGGVYVWQHNTPKCRFYEHPCPAEMEHTGGPLGFGRRYLDQIGWRPFQNPSCEYGAERLVREKGGTVEARPNACLTVRGKSVLNTASATQRRWRGVGVSIEPFAAWWSQPAPPPASVSVIVPFAGDCPWRKRALEWVTSQYEQLGWEVVIGHGDPENWCKADAIADALPRTSGDVLVIADGDVWAEHLHDAIAAVTSGAAEWAAPHKKVRRLTEKGTAAFLAGERDQLEVAEQYTAHLGGGLLVLPRSLYEQVPLDRRFVGWGQEDDAWACALRTVSGPPWRGTDVLTHLWHPPQARLTRAIGSKRSKALLDRYRTARRNPALMRALLDEAVTCGAVPA